MADNCKTITITAKTPVGDASKVDIQADVSDVRVQADILMKDIIVPVSDVNVIGDITGKGFIADHTTKEIDAPDSHACVIVEGEGIGIGRGSPNDMGYYIPEPMLMVDTFEAHPLKVLADLFSIIDNGVLLHPDKGIADQVGFLEELDFLADWNRLLTDQVRMTDDFFGEADIDDDQSIQFIKGVEDLPVFTELLEILFGKTPVDAVSIMDQAEMGVLTDQSDTISGLDTFAFLLGMPFTDNATVSDSNWLLFNKAPTDIVTLSEARNAHVQDYALQDYFLKDYTGVNYSI